MNVKITVIIYFIGCKIILQQLEKKKTMKGNSFRYSRKWKVVIKAPVEIECLKSVSGVHFSR